MSRSNETTKFAEPSLGKDTINLARHYFRKAANWARPYLGGRRGLILLGVAVLAAGAALNWDWLVALGIAPILVAFAPCAIMCALGLCMMKGGGKSCSTQSSSGNETAHQQASPTPSESERPHKPAMIASGQHTPAFDDARFDDGDERIAVVPPRTMNERS